MPFPETPFQIGPISVDPPLVMAPLHEITDQPFRKMIREVGGVGLTVSEMISCEALVRHARKAERMMASEGERPYAMQLAGSDPEHLAEAARITEASGADIVDLNMGCPRQQRHPGRRGLRPAPGHPPGRGLRGSHREGRAGPGHREDAGGLGQQPEAARRVPGLPEDVRGPWGEGAGHPPPHPVPAVRRPCRLEPHHQGRGGGPGLPDHRQRRCAHRRGRPPHGAGRPAATG